MLTYRYLPPLQLGYIPTPRPVLHVPRIDPRILRRLEPVLRQVGYLVDVTLCSYLPGSLPGETVSDYVARHNADITGRHPMVEKMIFHRSFAADLGVRFEPLVGIPAEQIAMFALRLMEG